MRIFLWDLRMYDTYIHNQKFDSIRISVHRDITKKKFWIAHIKYVKNIYFV